MGSAQLIMRQAGADITGQLQVRPMLYTLYIDINLRVVKMLHTYNKQQIRKLIQSPSKRRSDVTPGGAGQAPFRCNAGTKDFVSKEPPQCTLNISHQKCHHPPPTLTVHRPPN